MARLLIFAILLVLCEVDVVWSSITASSNLRIGKGFCTNAEIYLHCKADTKDILWTKTYQGISDVLFLFRPAFSDRTLQNHEFHASFFPNGNESFLFYGNATTNHTISCNRESFNVTILNVSPDAPVVNNLECRDGILNISWQSPREALCVDYFAMTLSYRGLDPKYLTVVETQYTEYLPYTREMELTVEVVAINICGSKSPPITKHLTCSPQQDFSSTSMHTDEIIPYVTQESMENVTSANKLCFQVSTLASSAAIICIISSLLAGIPALLLGLVGGIQHQKRKLKDTRKTLPGNSNQGESDVSKAAIAPVYEEIDNNKNALSLKYNIAYEHIQI